MSDPASRDLPILEDPFSPLQHQAALEDEGDDRRIAERVELGGPVRYRFPTIPAGETWAHGVVVNLSETGGCFLVDGGWSLVERLETEDWVPLDVEIRPDGGDPLRLRAEIVWVQPDGGGDSGVDRVGAKFDAVAPEELGRLRTFLEVARDDR